MTGNASWSTQSNGTSQHSNRKRAEDASQDQARRARKAAWQGASEERTKDRADEKADDRANEEAGQMLSPFALLAQMHSTGLSAEQSTEEAIEALSMAESRNGDDAVDAIEEAGMSHLQEVMPLTVGFLSPGASDPSGVFQSTAAPEGQPFSGDVRFQELQALLARSMAGLTFDAGKSECLVTLGSRLLAGTRVRIRHGSGPDSESIDVECMSDFASERAWLETKQQELQQRLSTRMNCKVTVSVCQADDGWKPAQE